MSISSSPPAKLIFSSFFLLFLFLFAAITVSPVAATDHIVGANRGWNPGINYTLWANNHTFYVGDLISFRYQKFQYNVFEVNQTGYDNCTMDGYVANWTSGKDFIPLDEAKRYYFICGNGQCMNGMKVSVLVHPLNSSSNSTANGTSSDSAAWPTVRQDLIGFRGLVVLAALIFLSFGLI